MNRARIKYFLISSILCICLPVWTVFAEESSAETLYEKFFKANQAYKEGNYSEAASLYGALIREGTISGSLLYNLGNCYWRLNRPGKAILNYERAKRFIPRDPDLDFNLRYVEERIKDRVETPSSLSFSRWLNNFSRPEIVWTFSIINLFFWGTLIVRLWVRSEWTFFVLVGLALLWIISGVSTAIKWYGETHDTRGVVVAPEITVHAGPDEADTTLFKLHAGTIVTSEREEEGWKIIQLTPEKRGWVKGEWVESISLNKTSIGRSP